jgi:hypothetical protein
MIVEKDPHNNWFSAHPFKFPYRVIARTRDDAFAAYDHALENKTANRDLIGSLFGESRLNIGEITQDNLKNIALFEKFAGILSIILGAEFAIQSYHNVGGLLPLVGLIPMVLGPLRFFQDAHSHDLLRNWMHDNSMTRAIYGVSSAPGARHQPL